MFRTETDDDNLKSIWADLRNDETQRKIPPIAIRSAVLEANIVRRLASDTRIRQLVWEDLDESGVMSPEDRQRLNQSGFRVGIAGNSNSWVLQNLAKDAVKAAVAHDDDDEFVTSAGAKFQQPLGPAFNVFEHGMTQLEVQSQIDVSVIPIEEIPELKDLRDTGDLRCVVQIRAEELEDGWVMLTVLPQLHSGSSVPRLSVAGNRDALSVRQKVYPLYEQQFRIKLHRGEVAVIGQFDGDSWSPGRLFFQPTTGSSSSASLLLIRLVSTNEVQGVSEKAIAGQ